MIRWHRVRTVAAFEFLSAVKRTGFLVITFGMPLFMAAYGAIVALPAYYMTKQDTATTMIGLVDEPGLLKLAGDTAAADLEPDEARKVLEATGQQATADRMLPRSRFVFRPFATDAEARAALVRNDIKAYFVVPSDYLAGGTVSVYTPETLTTSGGNFRSAFATLFREQVVTGRVDPALAARVVAPLGETKDFAVTRTGDIKDGGDAASAVRIGLPIAFTVLFLMSVLMTSGYLLQGTATEKENKVVEVLLASANPDEILAGKLLGLGGAGLLQVAVWMTMLFGTSLGAIPMLLGAQVEMPWKALLFAVPLFVVAFLFFGSLMLGTGSLGSNMREAQQLSMIWSLTAALPLMLMGPLIRAPHGVLAKVFTWMPLTAGPVVVMRSSMDPEFIAWWEVIGPLLVLLGATWFAIRFAARLFRIGLLSAGARPSLREVLRQARLQA